MMLSAALHTALREITKDQQSEKDRRSEGNKIGEDVTILFHSRVLIRFGMSLRCINDNNTSVNHANSTPNGDVHLRELGVGYHSFSYFLRFHRSWDEIGTVRLRNQAKPPICLAHRVGFVFNVAWYSSLVMATSSAQPMRFRHSFGAETLL